LFDPYGQSYIAVVLDRNEIKAKTDDVMASLPISHSVIFSAPADGVTATNSSNTLDLWVTPKRREFAGILRGREFTRKTCRLASKVAPIDQLIGGGIARGRISELTGRAGKTSLAAAFAANAVDRGEVVAWLDLEGRFDPSSMTAAGVDLARILWASPRIIERDRRTGRTFHLKAPANEETNEQALYREPREARDKPERAMLKAAEWLMAAGGFGLIVIDFGGLRWPLRSSVAMRLARGAEQSGAAVMILSARRMCGTFAALSLVFDHSRANFSRTCPGAPLLFDGFVTDVRVARNKLGGSQGAIAWKLTADPYEIGDAEGVKHEQPIEASAAIVAGTRAVS
jgi:hypothetical protein